MDDHLAPLPEHLCIAADVFALGKDVRRTFRVADSGEVGLLLVCDNVEARLAVVNALAWVEVFGDKLVDALGAGGRTSDCCILLGIDSSKRIIFSN